MDTEDGGRVGRMPCGTGLFFFFDFYSVRFTKRVVKVVESSRVIIALRVKVKFTEKSCENGFFT